jgi:predicted dehydrogenase
LKSKNQPSIVETIVTKICRRIIMEPRKLKIGVLGAGHLGKIHMRCILELGMQYELVGFYDTDSQKTSAALSEFGTMAFHSAEALMDAVDVVDIVTPTSTHFDLASKSIRRVKHTFIEKPVASHIDEARALIKLANEAQVKVQVGHVERFNPAYAAALPHFNKPKFIETHRLAQFNPRGTDVSVVLDLMIHDIDIVLATTGANVRRIAASGVAVLSDTPDIANARLDLDNGCVANLTASRISLHNMRKTRFFQRDAYIAVDFLKKQTEVVRMREVEGEPDPLSLTIDLGEGKGKKEIIFDKPEITEVNAIKEELFSFHQSIVNDKDTAVPLEQAARALDVAMLIIEKMKQHVLLQDDEPLL